MAGAYGGKSLHEQSHGEAFISLVTHRFGSDGFYVLDEPEAALSPARQLALLARIHDLVNDGSQCIIATHAPIVLSYPDATIYELSSEGTAPIQRTFEETDTVRTTVDFLRDRKRWLHELMRTSDDER
jgi:predicted ATPase